MLYHPCDTCTLPYRSTEGYQTLPGSLYEIMRVLVASNSDDHTKIEVKV